VTDLRSGEIAIDGSRSPLVEAGPDESSEAVVFVHGNPGSLRDWEDLVGRIGGFARAVAFDLPGFGGSEVRRDFGYRVEDYAAYLDAVREQLGVRRAHLVVHDIGGAIGLCWGASRPEALASAVMFNTGTWTRGRWHRMARLWRRPVIGEIVMASTNRPAWRRALHAGPEELPPEFVDRMYEEFDRGTRRAVLRHYRATPVPYPPASGWVETLRSLDRPALIVWGANDPYLGRRRVEDLKQPFPSAQVAMLERSGHFPFADDPEGTAAAVVPFLKSQVGVGAPA
jgi:pimeloyl-ACP methyl ester carboxylesterase